MKISKIKWDQNPKTERNHVLKKSVGPSTSEKRKIIKGYLNDKAVRKSYTHSDQ